MEQRIIKFKAKRLDNGQWAEGDLLHADKGVVMIAPLEGGSHIVNPSTVCQYTGLKDKEGKEIWEHDLLESPCNGDLLEVVYRKGAFLLSISTLLVFVEDGVCLLRNRGSKFDKEDKA